MKVLFVCSRNRLRSPTAEALFSGVPGLEVTSAGTAPDAECVVSGDLMEWADQVVVMERRQLGELERRFGTALKGKRTSCLGIPDRYTYMQPELVRLLKAKVTPLLGGTGDNLGR